MESVIYFKNKRKETLRGVLHYPEKNGKADQNDLIIFPNGGMMGSEGDYRAHLRMARFLEESGYHVLRFSPSGIGYSDGFIPDAKQRDIFGRLESGLFVDDITSAIKYASSILKFDSIALSGVCGGAISSFLAAAESKEVDYVIPIGIPVVLDGAAYNLNERMPEQLAKMHFSLYLEKIVSLKSWGRFLRRNNFFLLVRNDIATFMSSTKSIITKGNNYKNVDEENGNIRTNPKFFLASNKLLKMGKRILFIFGNGDQFWMEFEKLFLDRLYPNRKKLPFDYYLVPNGNHMLSWVEMQIDASKAMVAWLNSMKSHGT